MAEVRGRILIVDDEANARAALADLLREDGYVAEVAADGFKALGKLDELQPEVILTDLKMPGLDGLGLLERARTAAPEAVVIVMTAYGTIGSAVDAVKRGAENYLQKPIDDPDALLALVQKGVEKSRLLQEMRRLRDRLRERNAFGHVVGEHPRMKHLLEMIAQVGPSRATVLITGESGTGKELVAEAIHGASPRADRPMVRLNCAALAESLLESELFGHERGAFTGAVSRREGRFKQADGGTLFLDEVSEIPLSTQVKILRFLQTREIERVGGNESLKIDVRVIAATNKPLPARIADGRFREDLYYRLNVVTLEIPPLRERLGELEDLAAEFVAHASREAGRARAPRIERDALALLRRYSWPGNVRELRNVMARAALLATGDVLGVEHLPREKLGPSLAVAGTQPGAEPEDAERRRILSALEKCGGNQSRAAKLLGLSRNTLIARLSAYGVARPRGGR